MSAVADVKEKPAATPPANAAQTPPQTAKTTAPVAEKPKPLPVLVSYCLIEKRGLWQILEIRTQGKTVLSTTEVEEENLKIIGLDKIGVFIEMDLAGLKR